MTLPAMDWSDKAKRDRAIEACVSAANREINDNPSPIRIAAALGTIEGLWIMMADALTKGSP